MMMFSNQRKCLTEDEVLDILYNDDSGDDLIPELDSNSDSESDNEAYRTDIIHEDVHRGPELADKSSVKSAETIPLETVLDCSDEARPQHDQTTKMLKTCLFPVHMVLSESSSLFKLSSSYYEQYLIDDIKFTINNICLSLQNCLARVTFSCEGAQSEADKHSPEDQVVTCVTPGHCPTSSSLLKKNPISKNFGKGGGELFLIRCPPTVDSQLLHCLCYTIFLRLKPCRWIFLLVSHLNVLLAKRFLIMSLCDIHTNTIENRNKKDSAIPTEGVTRRTNLRSQCPLTNQYLNRCQVLVKAVDITFFCFLKLDILHVLCLFEEASK
ncbi:hypothetical protein C0J52_06712 [Blattella germanica]|nr:hypothetical protein C0J52_06712 [Blattella germanica]